MEYSSTSLYNPTERASKRARTDDKSSPSIVHSPDLWLADGTIILRTTARVQGAPTTVQTLYKVHKSTLAIHATFFFDGPQAAFDAALERYDGVSVMDMLDDAADVEDFLKAIYFPDYTHRHGQRQTGEPYWSNFPGMYTGILRLAQKYDAQKVRKVIVNAIKKEWPSKLTDWDERQRRFQKDKDGTPYALREELHPEPTQTIRLATEFDIPEVLPVAFYDIYRVTEYNRSSDGIDHHVNLRNLTVDDFCKLTQARVSLKGYVDNESCLALYEVKPTRYCDHVYEDEEEDQRNETEISAAISASPCMKGIKIWRRRANLSGVRSRDVLAEMKRDIEKLETPSLCESCQGHYFHAMRTRRQRLWQKLPDLFNVRDLVGPNWGA